jgi:hypothetical protein
MVGHRDLGSWLDFPTDPGHLGLLNPPDAHPLI